MTITRVLSLSQERTPMLGAHSSLRSQGRRKRRFNSAGILNYRSDLKGKENKRRLIYRAQGRLISKSPKAQEKVERGKEQPPLPLEESLFYLNDPEGEEEGRNLKSNTALLGPGREEHPERNQNRRLLYNRPSNKGALRVGYEIAPADIFGKKKCEEGNWGVKDGLARGER